MVRALRSSLVGADAQTAALFFVQDSLSLCQRATADSFCNYCQELLLHQRLPFSDKNWSAPLPQFIWSRYEGAIIPNRYAH